MKGPSRYGRAPYRRRTLRERQLLLEKIDDLNMRPFSEDAAAILKVSRSTLGRLNCEKSAIELLGVEKSISVLCNMKQHDLPEKLYSIFFFMNWLRVAHSAVPYSRAVEDCVTAYSSGQNAEKKVDNYEFHEAWRKPQSFSEASSAVAVIVQSLLQIAEYRREKAQLSSLGKVQYLSSKGHLSFARHFSWRNLLQLWQEHSSAAVFLYVCRYHSDIGWPTSPLSAKFSNDVNAILSEPNGVRRFFEKCFWISCQMKESVHPKTLAHVQSPKFASRLMPCAVQVPPLSNDAEIDLIEYNSALRY